MARAQNVQEKLEEGAIRCLVTFELVGKPKQHVEETLKSYVAQLEEEKRIDVLSTHQEEATELEGEDKGFFAAFSEIELVVPDLETLTYIAFNLMPASIEITGPDDFAFAARDLQNWLNDLLSQLHALAQIVRAERQKNKTLQRNAMRLLQNTVSVLLASGPKDAPALARMSGVEQEQIEKLLSQMEKESLVTREKDAWTLSLSKE